MTRLSGRSRSTLGVSPQEKASWYKYAQAQGVSVSELIRDAVNERVYETAE
jgi:Ribbon-helix-helix protein, copG family